MTSWNKKKDALSNRKLMISIPLSINALGIALCVALLCGGGLVLTSHVLTMRSMRDEMERWSELGYTLTETAERCVALLPAAWITNQAARLRVKIE